MRFKLYFLLTLLYFLIFPKNIFASEFEVNLESTYKISDQSYSEVKHDLEIVNKESKVFASEFNLNLVKSLPENISVLSNGKELKYELVAKGDQKEIKIFLPNDIVGLDKSQQINISYIDRSLVNKRGQVYEVNIPKTDKENIFNNYSVRLIAPKSLGKIAYISPDPDSRLDKEEENIFYFKKNTLEDSVSIAFGESQTFSFSIDYHIENPLIFPSSIEVAIPPDTEYQHVFYDKIYPDPDSYRKDADGNWLIKYELNSKQRIDVSVLGYVDLLPQAVKRYSFSQDYLNKNLLATDYWQTNDKTISDLAKDLSGTKEIYDYVVQNLTYDYSKTNAVTKRLGALNALKSRDSALCTEFTDLFIALSRAKGIPAREINGFAYTDNLQLKPLSLATDVLHSWPEYWDTKTSNWIPVDPTWGKTTGGADYFNKLDLKHFTFVTHGLSDSLPVSPGSYKLSNSPKKDVNISFASCPDFPKKDIYSVQKGNKILVTNPNSFAVYNQTVSGKHIEILMPFETKTISSQSPNVENIFDYKKYFLSILLVSIGFVLIISVLYIKVFRK